MKTYPTTTLLPILLLLSISLSALSQQIPINQFLPPFLAGYQDQTYFLSGLGQTLAFDLTSNSLSPILQDLEAACRISSTDTPFNPRLFVDNAAGSYYYCPQNKSLLILDSSQNFIVTGSHISLSNLPVFNEVKIKTFPSLHSGVIVLLGLVNAPNTLDASGKNYTESHMITISWESDSVISAQQLVGAHGEPIVDVEALPNNKIAVIGEKVYSCGEKMNTYYLGKWGDNSFNSVVDFYIATSFGFLPEIKGSSDGRYLVYTNYQSIFVYCTKTLEITQSFDVTLVSNNYTMNGQEIVHWEEIPFTLASQGKEAYIFYQGNLDKYSIPNINTKINGGSIPVEIPLVSTSTYSRFIFFEEQNMDSALVQMGNSTYMFQLDSEKNQFRSEQIEI